MTVTAIDAGGMVATVKETLILDTSPPSFGEARSTHRQSSVEAILVNGQVVDGTQELYASKGRVALSLVPPVDAESGIATLEWAASAAEIASPGTQHPANCTITSLSSESATTTALEPISDGVPRRLEYVAMCNLMGVSRRLCFTAHASNAAGDMSPIGDRTLE